MTKKVTLPLTPDVMVEFFKDKSTVYEVDLEASLSALNERSMLTYLANLGINCSFTQVNDNLLREYLTMKNFTNIHVLQLIHANLLYYAKYNEVLYPETLELFNEEHMIEFLQANVDVIVEQLVFLDSMMLYMLTRSLGEDEEQELTLLVDDQVYDEIGFSVIQLVDLSDFLICYSTVMPELDEQTYYARYFDEYMFQGKNLFHYACHGAFFGLIAKITAARENADDQKELDTLDSCLRATLNPPAKKKKKKAKNKKVAKKKITKKKATKKKATRARKTA